MKILWLTNIPLPEVSQLMNQKSLPYGGWLVNSSKYLIQQEDMVLFVAFPQKDIKQVQKYSGEKIEYFAFPMIDIDQVNNEKMYSFLEQIVLETEVDLVHIYGTEFAHSLVMTRICMKREVRFVTSIQGLVSIYHKHFLANLPTHLHMKFSIRDLLARENLLIQKSKMLKRGILEVKALNNSINVIGRTNWDKACTSQINPNSKYFHCNETLRESFYNHQWKFETCEHFSLFTSQAGTPIKGLHHALEAVAILKTRFSQVKLYVGGPNIIDTSSFSKYLRQSSYVRYIKHLIKSFKLEDNIVFTGVLDEHEMCQRFLKTHVFICPSSIENSPNSLGEAMLLGVPCISSDVGGVMDMMTHKIDGYVYQSDAPYMLAYYATQIFENNELASYFSCNGRNRALATHDRIANNSRLIEIYDSIIEEKVI